MIPQTEIDQCEQLLAEQSHLAPVYDAIGAPKIMPGMKDVVEHCQLSEYQRGYLAGYQLGETAGKAQGLRMALASLKSITEKAVNPLDEQIERVKGGQ